jgi:hypothetical protein
MPHFKSRRAGGRRRRHHALLWLAAASLLVSAHAQQPAAAQQTDGAQPSSDALLREGSDASDPAQSDALDAYQHSRSAHSVGWLQDGSLLISTRFGDTWQVHRVTQPLGMREQLSFAAAGASEAAARPYSNDEFAYIEPHRGGSTTQLWLQRVGQRPWPLTDGAHRDLQPVWSHDGTRIAFLSNRRNGVDLDVYLQEVASAGAAAANPVAPRLLAGTGGRWRIFDWSIDDRRLLLGHLGNERESESGAADAELFILELQSGELKPVGTSPTSPAPPQRRSRSRRRHAAAPSMSPSAMPLRVLEARFASDAQGLIVLARHAIAAAAPEGDSAVRLPRLAAVDSDGGNWRELGSSDDRGIVSFAQSPDGRYIAYVLEQGRAPGENRLMLIDQQRKLELRLDEIPPGLLGELRFDPSGKRLSFSLQNARSPRDVYVLDLDTRALTRWTRSEAGPLDPQAFLIPESRLYPTWDRVDGRARELPLLVYRRGAAIAGPAPVLIVICSGGSSSGNGGGNGSDACRASFQPFLQFLALQLGLVVLATEVQPTVTMGRPAEPAGSDAREDAVRDIGSLLVWIGLQPELDRNRVALMGEGFGGFVALAALADFGDRLRGALAAFPPPLSRLPNATAIRSPLMLVQGLDNPLVPAYEAEQLRSRLRADGVQVQYLAASDEGARFMRAANQRVYQDAAATFLARLLR